MVYKLIYFPIRAVAEPIRQLFKLAEKDFEDVRVTKEDFWATIKKDVPFGQVPVLQLENGEYLAQSAAIARFLAVEFGFAGKTPIERAKMDAIVDQYKDYMVEVKPFYYTVIGVLEGDADRLYKDVFLPAAEKFYSFLTTILKKNGTGFLVGDSVTYADLLIADHLVTINNFYPEFLGTRPEVKAHQEKINNIQQIKEWVATRPDNKF